MKKSIGAENCLYPTPSVIVGADINGKANYITIAWIGILGFRTIGMAMNKSHYTNQGIKENKTFSVNIPSVSMLKATDYVGMVSGKAIDKSKLFKNFYGRLKNAPMIEECAINMECELTQVLDTKSHEIFIGNIVETYCDDKYMTNGKVDLVKVQPFFFSMYEPAYWSLGEKIGKAWSIGKDFSG